MHEIIYPNEGYLVSYFSGSSGAFLSRIIGCLLASDNSVIKEFPNGTAHTFNPYADFNMLFDDDYHYLSFIDRKYKLRNYDHPFIHNEHAVPNWNKLFTYFPNLKNIIITMDERTSGRQILNMEIKNVGTPSSDVNRLKELLRKHELGNKKPKFLYPYSINDVVPDNKNIIRIPYYDIIHKKDSVLSTLSEITQRPIRKNIVQTYDNYLQAQYELYPWYDDK